MILTSRSDNLPFRKGICLAEWNNFLVAKQNSLISDNHQMFPAKWEHICRLLLPVQWQWEMDKDQKHACKKVIYLDEKLYFSIDKRYHLCLSVWPFSLCTFHIITDILRVSFNIPIYLSYCVFLIYPDYSVLFSLSFLAFINFIIFLYSPLLAW